MSQGRFLGVGVTLAALAFAGCGASSRSAAPPAAARIKLAILPAESDRFPAAAQAATESLSSATVAGVDDKEVSKVSLEVVQLSIECVELTVGCYEAVGKELAANRLLFAHIAPEAKKALKITVTLFDVDAREPKTAERVFSNEREASAGIADLVAEATR